MFFPEGRVRVFVYGEPVNRKRRLATVLTAEPVSAHGPGTE
jgi:hypothetical protein